MERTNAQGGVVPFTGSHPAAVLPFLRLGLPASALVIGSLVPDLPYYLSTPVTPAQTHALAGVLGADLVLGLCAYLVWHLLLVQPLAWIAPMGLQRRLPARFPTGAPSPLTTAGDLARVCAALALGALTHVAWDSFTHAGRWGPRHLPWLNEAILGLPLFSWLQSASSVAGLALMVWAGTRWWRTARTDGPTSPVLPVVRWAVVALFLGWAGWAAAQDAVARVLAPGRASRLGLVVGSLLEFFSSLLAAVILASVAWHVFRALRANRDRAGSRSP